MGCIGRIYEEAKYCRLSPSFFKKIGPELKYLSEYFKGTTNESFLIAMFFSLNFFNQSDRSLKELIDYLNCNPIKFLEKFNNDMEALFKRGILKKENHFFLDQTAIIVHDKVKEAILRNFPMPLIEKEITDVFDLLEKIHNLSKQLSDEKIDTFELLNEVTELISSHLHFPLIKKVNDLPCNEIENKYLFLLLVWETLKGNPCPDIDRILNRICNDRSYNVRFRQELFANENPLMKEGYIEFNEADFFNDAGIKLSDKSLRMLKEAGIKIHVDKKKYDTFIKPSKIYPKDLYYNEHERKQLDLLKNLLDKKNFKAIQERLRKKRMPAGITVLFHGFPGTGKTETVFQLARLTRREIVKLEISQSKSMWYGESEKIIKRIFTDYRNFKEECLQTPILLFNEADAIISRRQENTFSNVAQTENAIQNILLEELENFEGIFIATTNLVKNFDPAFQRRFLFKIEFKKPTIEVKARIWKAKLPSLSDEQCEWLASHFDFTGGQIENIVRKAEIQEVIYEEPVTMNHIINFCKTELLLKHDEIKMGFIKT